MGIKGKLIPWSERIKGARDMLKRLIKMNNPLNFFRIQKTNRYLRFKFGQLNIYFSWHPLKTRPVRRDEKGGSRKAKRKRLKRELLERDTGGCCEICGKALTWEEASVHHIVPVSQDPTQEFDINNLQLLCIECHVNLHKIEHMTAQLKKQTI